MMDSEDTTVYRVSGSRSIISTNIVIRRDDELIRLFERHYLRGTISELRGIILEMRDLREAEGLSEFGRKLRNPQSWEIAGLVDLERCIRTEPTTIGYRQGNIEPRVVSLIEDIRSNEYGFR